MLTISPAAGGFDPGLPAVATNGDGFAPLMAGLLATGNGKPLPLPGDTMPIRPTPALTDAPIAPDALMASVTSGIPAPAIAPPTSPEAFTPPSPNFPLAAGKVTVQRAVAARRSPSDIKGEGPEPQPAAGVTPSIELPATPPAVVAPAPILAALPGTGDLPSLRTPAAMPDAVMASSGSTGEEPNPVINVRTPPATIGDVVRASERSATRHDVATAVLVPPGDQGRPPAPALVAPLPSAVAGIAIALAPAVRVASVALAPGEAVHPSLAPDPALAPAAPGRQPADPVVPDRPTAQPAAPPSVILPALQMFGAAIRQALADERRPVRKDGQPDQLFAGVAAISTPMTAVPVAPADATLDTADRRWPQAMAAHIDRLLDAANEQSTRIRLLPDALGRVDVSVRRDGEQVHVHFAAAQPETRQLLIDAQPRLADAAETRGVRLGRTDVSGGDLPTDRQQQRTPAQNPQPSRPAPARTHATVADETDSRLA